MSHTFKGESCVIHYDGAFDGDVSINNGYGPTISVSIDDLLQFAAEYARQEKISKLETAHWRDVLLGRV